MSTARVPWSEIHPDHWGPSNSTILVIHTGCAARGEAAIALSSTPAGRIAIG